MMSGFTVERKFRAKHKKCKLYMDKFLVGKTNWGKSVGTEKWIKGLPKVLGRSDPVQVPEQVPAPEPVQALVTRAVQGLVQEPVQRLGQESAQGSLQVPGCRCHETTHHCSICKRNCCGICNTTGDDVHVCRTCSVRYRFFSIVYLFIHLFVYLFIHLFVCLFICLFV